MEQLVGQWIGQDKQNRYQLTALLGQQTGRRTYLANDAHSSQSVVVKLILFGPDFAWRELRLFEREAETLKSLRHGAIPDYLDSFEVDTDIGKGFALVQTHIEARSLQTQLEAGRSFSEDDLRAIAHQLLNILVYLHSQHSPVIHRDIKPSNILLTDAQKPMQLYLVDFGAVQTVPTQGTMTIVGTYGYMPIEQFSGRALPASDLYSLGATLVYLSTGKHPAEMVQSNLQLNFEPYTHFTPAFTQWLKQLTCADLSLRTPSAQAAINALNQRGSQLAESSLPLFSMSNNQQNSPKPTRNSDHSQSDVTQSSRTTAQINKSPLPLFPSFRAPLNIAEASSQTVLSLNDIEIKVLNESLFIQLLKSRTIEKKPFLHSRYNMFLLACCVAVGLLVTRLNSFAIMSWVSAALLASGLVTNNRFATPRGTLKTKLHICFSQDGTALFNFGNVSYKKARTTQTTDRVSKDDDLLDDVYFPIKAVKLGAYGYPLKFIFSDGTSKQRILHIHGDRQEVLFLYKNLVRYGQIAMHPWDRMIANLYCRLS